MRVPNEIKAGIVIVLAAFVCVVFFFKTTSIVQNKYELKTYFSYADDLKADALVKLSGIEVGRVKEINFIYGADTKVECVLEVDGRARVRQDAIAYIGKAGFVGDTFIGITAGSSTEFVKPGDTVNSEEPVQMRELMKKADDIASNLDKILADIREVVGDNKQNVNDIVLNLEATTENFKEFSEDVKRNPWKLLFKQSGD